MKNSGLLLPPELLTESHDRSRFACGKPALNQFLKKYAS